MEGDSRVRRPRVGETEEDLLAQMRQFEQKGSAVPDPPSLKRPHEPEPADEPSPSSSVLSAVVVERQTVAPRGPVIPSSRADSAFPPVMVRDVTMDTAAAQSGSKKKGGKRVSLFARQMAAKSAADCDSNCTSPWAEAAARVTPVGRKRPWGDKSKLLHGSKVLTSKDQEDIHMGNINILDGMSEEQLKKDRDELLKTMDPSLVKFLTKRSKEGAVATTSSPHQHQPDVEMAPAGNLPLPKEMEMLRRCKVERDKMEWMRDLDEEEEEGRADNFSARFDFSGRLMPFKSEEIPVNAGLHHHGEEPDRPGYTLEELLTLARSTYLQQRTMAFDTLANIINNHKQGRYDDCFSANVFHQLLRADLVTLLRLALDDSHNSVAVLNSALGCLASVLDNEVEEAALDAQFFAGGHIQPSLATAVSKNKEFRDEVKELKDVQVMGADLVLGLLRTDVLDRLAYLIDNVVKPSGVSSVLHILRIVVRISRHSLDVALKVAHHPKLVPALAEHFLPRRADPSADTLYGRPVWTALKVVRVLAAWGKGVATELADKYDVGPTLLCYMSLDPSGSQTPTHEALRLTIEAARTWTTFLNYGLLTDQFVSYHPVLMRQLLFLKEEVSMNGVRDSSKFNFHFGSSILEVIRSAVCCLPTTADTFSAVDRAVAVSNSSHLEWSQFIGVLEVTEHCLKKWSTELSRNRLGETRPFCLQLFSSALSFFATFVRRHSLSDAYDPIAFPDKIREIATFVSKQVSTADFYVREACPLAEKLSIFNDALKDGRLRDPESLPSLGTVKFRGDITGCLREESPFAFLAAYTDFLASGMAVTKDLGSSDCLLASDCLKTYLKTFGSNKRTRSNWFSKPELCLVHNLLQINDSLGSNKFLSPKASWKCAMALASHLQLGSESQLLDLFRRFVFSPRYLDPTELALATLSQLDLSAEAMKEDTTSAAASTPVDKSTLDRLCQLYEQLVLSPHSLKKSVAQTGRMCYSVTSQTLGTNGETVLPSDWSYLPLLTLMNREDKSQVSGEDEVQGIRRCLLWVYVTTVYNQEEEKLTNFSASLRVSRLATLFLAAQDLFLDPPVHKLAKMCLWDTLSRAANPLVRFDETLIPGIESFGEFHKELITQFESVSYGDNLFALMVLLPLTARNPCSHRVRLWQDHREALRNIVLKCSHLPQKLVTAENFVGSGDSADLVKVYVSALLNGDVLPQRNELMCKIAVVGVRTYLKNCANPSTDVESSLVKLKEVKPDLYSEIVN